MYRASDPRFRRRLNEIGQTVETATESAQSGLYIFCQRYVKPCFEGVSNCFTTCVDASCPAFNYSQRDRLRRQRGRARSRGRAELNFDFYDDWDDLDENDGVLGWGGNDEFDRLLAGSGATGNYGAVAQQPSRQKGMNYPRARRKSAAQLEADPRVIPGSSGQGFFGRLFGGKALRYQPSAADLQEHPGARRLARDFTEGEALLEESDPGEGHGAGKNHGRNRSGTATSGNTTDSFSSRGDIFPSGEELEDAIPLDDEFAMVLERRNTFGTSGPETGTESSSSKTARKKGKRPSTSSRTSTRRTDSSRSMRSSVGKRRSRNNSEVHSPIDEDVAEIRQVQEIVPTFSELKQEEARVEQEEEADVARRRAEAQNLAIERGLSARGGDEELPSKEAMPQQHVSPARSARQTSEEPSQLPTPLPTDDEEESAQDSQPGKS
ncbi:hypothetical protein EJ03DRAFT_327021 [Teratosphaeria nubilosa]|uniref:Uncharacterized protein n=1 Tax=Teratosphaeria nubilosa TaxID=161662 RepID=A0A6G1LBT2_9PEZI|nr:hypothetical protein EJ03DRAFT_327021 [Teratosphaeria nubilosa]